MENGSSRDLIVMSGSSDHDRGGKVTDSKVCVIFCDFIYGKLPP